MKIGVIGTGASGTSFMLNLKERIVKEPLLSEKLEVVVYEKGPRTGPGAGYNPDLNLTTDTMNLQSNEVFRNARDLFRDWLAVQPDDRLKGLGYIEMMERQDPGLLEEYERGAKTIGQLVSAREHDITPRIGVGAFLSDKFEEARTELEALGTKVTVLTNTEVVAAKPKEKDRGWILTAQPKDGTPRTDEADVMCKFTGYWERKAPDGRPGVFYSGFPAKVVAEGADLTSPVAQLGTGVFGGEAPIKFDAGTFERGQDGVMKFTRHPGNENFKVVMFSTSGQLHAVKGRTSDYQATYLTPDAVEQLKHDNKGFLPLDGLVDLFKKEIALSAPDLAKAIPNWKDLHIEDIHAMLNKQRETMGPRDRLAQDLAYAKKSRTPGALSPIPWQNPLMLLFVFVDRHLNAFSAEDRIRFDKAASTILKDVELITVPTAERLLAMIDAGAIEVVKARNFTVDTNDGSDRGATISYIDEHGEHQQQHFNTFVQAGSGAHAELTLDPSPLTKNLLDQRLISPAMIPFRDQALGRRLFDKAQPAQPDAAETDLVVKADPEFGDLKGRVTLINDTYYLNAGGIHIDDNSHVIAPDEIGKKPSGEHLFFSQVPDKKGLFPVGGGLTIGNHLTAEIADQIVDELKLEFTRPRSTRVSQL